MTKNSLVSCFPSEYKPTSLQQRVLSQIETFLNSKEKFLIFSAPTGTGKSFICKALCNATNRPSKKYVNRVNSYDIFRKTFKGEMVHKEFLNSMSPFGGIILTITKSLQDQYAEFFPDTPVYKGKANYMCDIDPNFDVETAPCVLASKLREKCWSDNICPYFENRNTALSSQTAVVNYRKFFAMNPDLRKRELLVCDEASQLEDELVSTFSVTLKYNTLAKHNVQHTKLRTLNYTKMREWVNELLFEVIQELNHFNATKRHAKLSAKDMSKWRFLLRLSDNLSLIESNWNNCEYVITKKSTHVTFAPLKVDRLSRHLFDYGNKVILTSATIIDPAQFAKSLGISSYKVIDISSDFDPDKSPIYVSEENKVSFKTKHRVLPKLVKMIDKILDHHKKDKGVIHTHTQEIADYVSEKVQSNRLLVRDVTNDNEAILQKHSMLKKPTVLVSPSLGFGVDLKDSLARFQIIVKTPYPPLNDKRVEKLFKTDKDWYFMKTVSSLVQMCGRATRSDEDHSVTYILDGNAVRLIQSNKDKLPSHFINRIQ